MRTIALILLLLTACNNQSLNNKQTIDLFNNTFITIEQGENLAQITPSVKEKYFSLIKNSAQIPLFRYIRHKHYEMFIGIPVNTSLNEMITGSMDLPNQQLIMETDTKTSYYVSVKSDSIFIIKYIKEIEHNLISILATTKTESVRDSLLSYEAISERLQIKQ